jgi:YbbR domain-containing protein
VFRILSETLDLPRGVSVIRLTPSEVTLEFAQTLRRRVPVHVATMGKAPHGLLITSTRVAPEFVEVVGPADQVEQIKAVETEPVELAEAQPGIIERDLSLDAPREYISLSANLVHAELVLQEPARTRTLANVPVVVRNSPYRTAVRPAVVQVTVRGPRSAMESLELDHGAVYIDATGQEPGTYDVTPAVDLPGDIELVKQEPSSIELRVLRQKQKTDGR